MKELKLKNIIKENLIIEDLKQRLLKESNGIPFHNLPHNKKMRISYLYLYEVNKMLSNKTLSEQVDLNSISNYLSGNRTDQKIVSAGASGVGQYFGEWFIKKILKSVGITEGWLLDTIVNYFLDDPMAVIKSFSDCKLMTEKIIDALVETILKRFVDGPNGLLGKNAITEKLGGVLRNSVMELFQNAEWKRTLVAKFTPIVCQYISKFKSSAGGWFSNMFK